MKRIFVLLVVMMMVVAVPAEAKKVAWVKQHVTKKGQLVRGHMTTVSKHPRSGVGHAHKKSP